LATPSPSSGIGAFKRIDPSLRTFLLLAVALAYPAWDVGFEVGVYGQVFFEKVFTAWAVSTALLIAFVATARLRKLLRPLGWWAMCMPTVWLLVLLVFRSMPHHRTIGVVLFALGLVTYVACLPYALYVGLSVAYPDLLDLRGKRPKLLLLLLVGGLLAAGFGIGRNHRWFLTCEDFEISGSHVPADCRPAGAPPVTGR
jgi:hypothetical protein